MSFWSKKTVNTLKSSFHEEFALEQRVRKRKALEQRYPKDSFTYLVIEGLNKFPNQKNGFILIGVQNSMPITFLIQYLRKSLNLGKTMSLFIEVGGKVREVGKRIGEINKQCKSDDGFLYMKLKTQNTFGFL